MEDFGYIKRNYQELTGEISTLSAKLGTPVPTLVSVTKSGSDEEFLALIGAGATDIGENRPGEVMRRGELAKSSGFAVRMHEIGTLQRNKIKLIADSVSMIHSVDSLSLAKDINRHAVMRGRIIPVLIEINSAKEEQKSGVFPEDAERLLYDISDFPGIEIKGLMTMGPVSENPEALRQYFRETKTLFDKLNRDYGFGDGATLSMGMSDSWRVAVEEGSTLVRVGRRLFTK